MNNRTAELVGQKQDFRRLRYSAAVFDSRQASHERLRCHLQRLGYRVTETTDREQALEQLREPGPDIFFTDDLPTIRCARELRNSRFVPIVFLNSTNDEDSVERCFEMGADDSLDSPIEYLALKTKIMAMERVSLLHERFGSLYRRLKKDEETAVSVFSGAVLARNVAMDQIATLLRSADLFSGDVLLSAYTPSGDLNVVLGDFTGHGLAAAIGALPASEVFRAMTNKGFSPQQILSGINRKLNALLPTSMFFAVQFISLSRSLRHMAVCNCGMPDILLIDGKSGDIKHRFASRCLPLSIEPEIDFQETIEYFSITPGDQILLMSDGALEARSPDHEYFGQSRLEQAILGAAKHPNILAGIGASLDAFRLDAPQDDDISLAVIPCLPALVSQERPDDTDTARQTGNLPEVRDATEFSMTLCGGRLREIDPIPLVVNHLQEIAGLGHQRKVLYTVLTELYVNALDHGVLGLHSEMKQEQGGFSRYFREREQRLSHLKEGSITLRIVTRPRPGGGSVDLYVEDSGDGFDFQEWGGAIRRGDEQSLSGRGIGLVTGLCESLHYRAPGNRVKAVFSWVD